MARLMFDDIIQAPFAKAVEQICPSRKNFLNYKYTLRKCRATRFRRLSSSFSVPEKPGKDACARPNLEIYMRGTRLAIHRVRLISFSSSTANDATSSSTTYDSTRLRPGTRQSPRASRRARTPPGICRFPGLGSALPAHSRLLPLPSTVLYCS